MHPVLLRQLKKFGIDPENPPALEQWRLLLERIDQSYRQADQERYTLERSLTISSREMRELYDALEEKSESRLAREKDKLEIIIHSLGDGLCWLDEQGRVLLINTEAERLLGVTRGDLQDACLLNALTLEGAPAVCDKCEDCLADWLRAGMLRRDDATFRRRDGSELAVSFVLNPVRQNGKLLGAVFTFRDISLRKEAEAKLRQSEERFRALVETVKEWIWETDRDGVYTYASPQVQHLLGYLPEEVIGRTPFDFMTESEAERVRQEFQDIVAEKKAFSGFENINRKKSGELVVLETSGVPVFNDRDELVGYRGIDRDVTVRKQFERQLQQAAAVFSNTAEGIVVTDRAGRIVVVNPAFSRISGYAQEEVVGKNPSLWKSGVHDEAFYRGMWSALEANGQWRGELWNRRKNGEIYPQWGTISAIRDDTGAVAQFVAVFSDISEIKRSQERLRYLADHDPLTGLPNRRLANDRLEHALQQVSRNQAMLAVLFLDLDRFKTVNDTLGHPVGDRLLKEIGERLASSVRREDTVSRLGGDEFLIIVEHINEPHFAATVARKVQDALSHPVTVDEHDIFVNASIGISLFPQDGHDATTLVRNADAAMYRAKEKGFDSIQFYTEEMTETAFEHLSMESALRRALERREFVVEYQPQVDICSCAVHGAEALVRWRHPEKGLLMPSVFIPLAEEMQLIDEIGGWVLQEACLQASRWQRLSHAPVRVSVNLCGQQLSVPGFVDRVKKILEVTGLEAALLELEITEGSLMQYASHTVNALNELRELGIAIGLDDFGTGYSSLSYLKRYAFDTLKIDRAFVHDVDRGGYDEAIANAVVVLGRSLHLRVVAEGVETEAQRSVLERMGCNEMQGFLFSPALSAQAFAELLRQTRRTHGSGTG